MVKKEKNTDENVYISIVNEKYETFLYKQDFESMRVLKDITGIKLSLSDEQIQCRYGRYLEERKYAEQKDLENFLGKKLMDETVQGVYVSKIRKRRFHEVGEIKTHTGVEYNDTVRETLKNLLMRDYSDLQSFRNSPYKYS